MRYFPLFALLVALFVSVPVASAEADDAFVSPSPIYQAGFADLHAFLGDEMGLAASEEFLADDASGYTLQFTSTGLLYWQVGQDPTWTNGWRHVALVGDSLVAWEGESLTPPPVPAAPILTPRDYLYARYPGSARPLDAIIGCESEWRPEAENHSSRAAGLAQFLRSTWATTPQGRAGLSPFDPYANIDGAAWLFDQVRGQPWVASYRCHGVA